MELLLECRQYLIKRKKEGSSSFPDRKRFLGDGVTWPGDRPVVTNQMARRVLLLHRVEVGKG